jgi:hypothetical protein
MATTAQKSMILGSPPSIESKSAADLARSFCWTVMKVARAWGAVKLMSNGIGD